MKHGNSNPPISTVLKIFTSVEFVVLSVVSLVLFLLPDLGASIWAWTIAPFATRFLGAVYFASAVAVGYMLFVGKWAPARVILPMLFTFTFTVLIVTLWKNSVFLYDRPTTWGWFILYIALPIDALVHIYLYRNQAPADQRPMPKFWSNIAAVFAAILVAYGLGQLFMPTAFSSFWPWAVDDFQAQLYSGIFLTAAVGLYMTRQSSARIEGLAVGVTLTVWGFFSLLGLILVDSKVHKVNWAVTGPYIWIGLFAVILLTGITLTQISKKLTR